MNITKLSPGFGRSPAVGQVLTPSALSPRSVHPTGHRDGSGTIQLRSTGHAGALAARGRRGEDLQQDRRGPGLVEGGNQRKSECIQITSRFCSAWSSPLSTCPARTQPAASTAKGRGMRPTPSCPFLARGWAVISPEPLLCHQSVLCDRDT